MSATYFGTYRGFLVLVDKEWCAFGHKFQDRIGHAQNKPNDTERSPIFIQFLDAVFQMIKQFPAAFEFSEELLIAIAEALFSGRFGNFIYNTLKERETNGLPEKTRSLWPYLIQNQAIYENPFYNKATENHICIPNPSILKLVFWSRLHAKYDPRTTEDQLVKWGQQKKKQMSQTTM